MTDAPTLRDKLNPLYASFFGSFFDRPTVEEPRATCESCAMCDQGQLAPVSMGYFDPDLKCCTFHPSLPNYLVGAILSDESPELAEGQRRIRAKIAARTGVTPMGVMVPRKWLTIYRNARSAFGRAKSLLCPYYSSDGGGTCTVWKWREAVCSTFFCKYERGKPGWEFWTADKEYLQLVQLAVSQAVVGGLDPTLDTTVDGENAPLTQEDVDDLPPSDAEYSARWGAWVGREEELYKKVYANTLKITPAFFARNVETLPEIEKARARLETRYDAIHSPLVLPERLVRARNLQTREAGESVVVASYNKNDSFALDRDLFDVLAKLDGTHSLAENLKRLDEEEDIQLETPLLEYLFQHGVVTAPEDGAKDATTPEATAGVSASTSAGPSRNQKKAARRKQR